MELFRHSARAEENVHCITSIIKQGLAGILSTVVNAHPLTRGEPPLTQGFHYDYIIIS